MPLSENIKDAPPYGLITFSCQEFYYMMLIVTQLFPRRVATLCCSKHKEIKFLYMFWIEYTANLDYKCIQSVLASK